MTLIVYHAAGPLSTAARTFNRAWLRRRRQHESATPTCNFRRIPEIRRPWPLQFMAANGRRQNRRKQVRAGSGGRLPKGPGELATLILCPHCVAPAAASGTGHCPALTLSNAVLWFASEVDTFLSIQLLVGAGRRGQLQLNHEISRKVVPRARRG